MVARSEEYIYPLLLLYHPAAIKGKKYLCQWPKDWTPDSVVDFLEHAYEQVLVKGQPEDINNGIMIEWRNYNYRDSESESKFRDERPKEGEEEEQEKVKTLVQLSDW